MIDDIKKIPKVELHLHLDGSVRVDTIQEEYLDSIKSLVVAPNKCLDLGDYLTRFTYPVAYLQTKEHLERVCLELSHDLEDDGVVYAEVRFAPLKHASILSLDEVVDTCINSFKKGNVKVNLILCMMRNDSFSDNLKVIELASTYLNRGVVAIDLAGDEKKYPTSSFEELFNIITKKEIPFTIHAGEIDSLTSLEAAIKFKAKRIGHGIQAINYPTILNLIKTNNILLEICPTSNIQTNVVSSYENHPILKLKEAGVKLSINTDNRTVSDITLSLEYKKLIDTFNFTLEDFSKFNIDAINSSFLIEEEKDKYREIILSYLNVHK